MEKLILAISSSSYVFMCSRLSINQLLSTVTPILDKSMCLVMYLFISSSYRWSRCSRGSTRARMSTLSLLSGNTRGSRGAVWARISLWSSQSISTRGASGTGWTLHTQRCHFCEWTCKNSEKIQRTISPEGPLGPCKPVCPVGPYECE